MCRVAADDQGEALIGKRQALGVAQTGLEVRYAAFAGIAEGGLHHLRRNVETDDMLGAGRQRKGGVTRAGAEVKRMSVLIRPGVFHEPVQVLAFRESRALGVGFSRAAELFLDLLVHRCARSVRASKLLDFLIPGAPAKCHTSASAALPLGVLGRSPGNELSARDAGYYPPSHHR